jgi:hypothetical protein
MKTHLSNFSKTELLLLNSGTNSFIDFTISELFCLENFFGHEEKKESRSFVFGLVDAGLVTGSVCSEKNQYFWTNEKISGHKLPPH